MAAKVYFGRQPAVHYFWRLNLSCISRRKTLDLMHAQIRDGRLAVDWPLPADLRGLELTDDFKLWFVVKREGQFAFRNRPQSQWLDAADYHVKIAGKKPAGVPDPEPYVRLPDGTWIPNFWVLAPQLPKAAPRRTAPVSPQPASPPSPRRPWATLSEKERARVGEGLEPFYKALIGGERVDRGKLTFSPKRTSIVSSLKRCASKRAPIQAYPRLTRNAAVREMRKILAQNNSNYLGLSRPNPR